MSAKPKRNILVAPVVKWVGGKRQLINELERFLPKKGWSYPMSPSLLSLFRYYFPNSSTNWFGSFQTFSRVRNSL